MYMIEMITFTCHREWLCLTFSSECHCHALTRGSVSDYMKYGPSPFMCHSTCSQCHREFCWDPMWPKYKGIYRCVQEKLNSSVLALELCLSCTNLKSEGFLSVYREWRCLTFSSECHWHTLRIGSVSDYMKYGSLSFHVPFHMQSVMSQRILWRQNVDEMLKHIQCSAIITWFIFSKVWTKDTP